MNKVKSIGSILLAVLMTTVALPAEITQAKTVAFLQLVQLDGTTPQAQQPSLSEILRLSRRPDCKGGAQNRGCNGNSPGDSTIQGTSFDDFFTLDARPKDKGGGRGDSFCPIAPLSPNVKPRVSNFLSDRPTFVWEGEAVRIEVRPIGEDTAVWGKDLQPNQRTATYSTDQPALLPNKTYKLWFKLASGATYDDVTFSVLSADQRQPVQLALQQLVNQMPANQKSDKSAIAAQQAIYLGKQKLWLDAYSVLFSLPQSNVPPQELANWNKGIEAIRQSVCKPPK